jgi:hypothetical protein
MIANVNGKILWTSAIRLATSRCAVPPVPASPMTRNLTDPSFFGSRSRSWSVAGAVQSRIRTTVAMVRRTG